MKLSIGRIIHVTLFGQQHLAAIVTTDVRENGTFEATVFPPMGFIVTQPHVTLRERDENDKDLGWHWPERVDG